MDCINEMNNLVASMDVKEYEGQPVVSSREVANNFEKQHKHVLECIENLIKKSPSAINFFIESKYQHPQNKRWYKEYLLTRKGIKVLHDSVRVGIFKNQLGLLYKRIGEDTSEIIMMPERFETIFFDKLNDTLSALGIELETQKNVLNYRLDGYIPQFNLAIEYDEAGHRNTSAKKSDIQRETEIKKEIGCKFIRLDYENTDAFNIGLVIKNIFSL